jgi:glycosyltransferase involved in cell wall biosynthesis
LPELAEELGIARRVRFLGFIPDDALADHVASADVFVHMNWAESALAPYEALALGTKVVWSSEMEMDAPIAATRLAFPADPTAEATAAAILRALAAPASRAGRAYLASYTWDRYYAAFTDIVRQEMGSSDR